MCLVRKIKFNINNSTFGSLAVYEDTYFSIKRVYFIYDSDGKKRGGHRHKTCHQILVLLSGSCEYHATDGVLSETILLKNVGEGVIIPPEHFHEFVLENDGRILVLASENYDPADYIHAKY